VGWLRDGIARTLCTGSLEPGAGGVWVAIVEGGVMFATGHSLADSLLSEAGADTGPSAPAGGEATTDGSRLTTRNSQNASVEFDP
jgi:hypothetical protein